MPISRSLTILGSVLIIMVGGLWIAHAATTPDPITACATKPGNQMRFSSTGTCKSGETMLVWNTAGVPGTDGAPGISGYEIITVDKDLGQDFGFSGTVFAECPEGKKVLEGGITFHVAGESGNFSGNAYVRFTSLLQNGTVWSGDVIKEEPTSIDTARVTVACATVAP